MEKLSRFFGKWSIPIILLVCLWTSSNVKWGKEHWKTIITSDGKGYYAYLPAVFIYQDLNFGFFDTIEKTYYDEHTKYDFRTDVKGKTIDKYFCGVALMQSPFFLVAHLTTKISGGTADGYSKLYTIFANLAAIFYLGIGLIYLRKLLRKFNSSIGMTSFLLFVIVFGTNLFYYTFIEPCMSHVYSFALISMFLVYGKKWMDSGKTKYVFYVGALLGFIFLVRPVNLFVIAWLPFAAGSVALFLQRIKELYASAKNIALVKLLFLAILSIQFILYYFETGKFIIDAYGSEHFDFTKPELVNFLFSYKKGLFIYLPLIFVSLFGFIPLWKKDRFRAVYLFGMLSVLIYILSSWWMWYYGGSFGTRVIVEYLPIFALLLSFLLRSIQKKMLQYSLNTLIVVLTLFCQIQTLQYRFYVIHWSDMTKEKYWDVFMNFDFLMN